MNIGIEATSAADAQKAGIGYYTYNLLRSIALFHRNDHTYTLYLRRPWPDSLPFIKTNVKSKSNFITKILNFPYLWAQVRLPIELWRNPQNVYFFPVPVIPLFYHPSKSVITVHDIAFLFFPDCFAPMLRRWLTIATRHGIASAKRIIAVSESTRKDIISYYNIPPGKVVAIHHGIHERFAVLKNDRIEAVKKAYQIEGTYILCIGTLQRRKNIPRLLQAFSLLKHKHNIPQKLVLIGQKHPDLPEHEIFSTIKQLSLQKDVLWTGYIDEQDMPALLNGADLFVLPSLYEGFGMPVLEAMACGVPVVCSNTSSLPEVVRESAVMFDPYNVESMAAKMYRVLMDQGLQSELSRRGLRRAKDFSWSTCARKTLAVLEEVGRGN